MNEGSSTFDFLNEFCMKVGNYKSLSALFMILLEAQRIGYLTNDRITFATLGCTIKRSIIVARAFDF
jgi:hypothetical protein